MCNINPGAKMIGIHYGHFVAVKLVYMMIIILIIAHLFDT